VSDFSIGDTATAGVRLLWKRPLTLLYWFGLTLLLSAAATALMFSTGALSLYQQLLTQNATPDPAAMMTSMGRLFGVVALMIPVYLLFFAVMTTAAVRAVLQPEKSAFGYLRLGGAELRTLVVVVAMMLILFVAYAVLVFVAAIIGGVAIGGAAAGDNAGASVLAVLFMIFVIIAVMVGLAWFATRMSLALPQSFDTRSINIFGTWAITKGKTGRLFLAYLLAFLIYFGISMTGGLINVAIMGKSMIGLFSAGAGGATPDMSAFFEMGPAKIVSILVSAVVATLGTAVMVCPSAEAYLELANRPQRDADVFA
jgi:hypothetical protein